MILLLAVVIAFLVGLLRGGKPAQLVSPPLQWPLVPLVAFGLQSVVIYSPQPQSLGNFHSLLLLLSYCLIVLAIWVNRRVRGMIFLGLGLLLNLTVMLANGGYMPITPEIVETIGHDDNVVAIESGTRVVYSKDIVLPREQTRFWLLSDILPLPPPFPYPTVLSPGDLLIAGGAFWIVQYAMLGLSSQGQDSLDPDAVPEANAG
jgi:hypothetical protein